MQHRETEPGDADIRLRDLPPALWAWLGFVALSQLGDIVLRMGLSWTSTAIGPIFAGWVTSATLLPSVLLLLVGGSLGDRYGQRVILLIATCVSIVQYTLLTFALHLNAPVTVLLIANAVVSGVLSGIRAPSSIIYARTFVPPEQTRRAIACSSAVSQSVSIIAPAAAGLLVAQYALKGAVLFDLATFILLLSGLLLLQPRYLPPPPTRRPPMITHLREGFTQWSRQREIVALTVGVSLMAGTVMPLVGLCLPLYVRSNGWSASDFGVLEAAWSASTLATSLTIAAKGTATRPIIPLLGGPFVCAAGAVALAFTHRLIPAVGCVIIIGLGLMLFTGHASPVFVQLTPEHMLSRFSSILQLSQMLPVGVLSPALGYLAHHAGLKIVFLIQSCGVLLVMGIIAHSHRLRHALNNDS